MDTRLKNDGREPLGKGVYVCVSAHHTFGTDAILLAHFSSARKKDRLLDLGTGCGIIPFLLLRDGLTSEAVGVDISPEAITLANRTATESGFENLHFIESDLNDLKGKVPFGYHTLVTCNPPYKAPDGGLKNEDPLIAAARHELFCTLEDIVSVSARALQTSGRLCMCHRPERLAELMRLMSHYGLEPKRLRLVCQRVGESPWLVLLEGRRGGKTGLTVEPTLYVEENGALSKEMQEIYGCYKEEHESCRENSM